MKSSKSRLTSHENLLKLALILGVLAPAIQAQVRVRPGDFDYYSLTLSWSPEFCYSHPTDAQCGKGTGFIVHGLWPESRSGRYPAHCQATQPAPSNDSPVADIMPTEIIGHEWLTHGTCTGLSGDEYLRLIRQAAGSIKIPPEFQSPHRSFTLHPQELKAAFERANPQLRDESIAVQFRRGYLDAVKICLAKSPPLQPTACAVSGNVRNGTFRVPPVR